MNQLKSFLEQKRWITSVQLDPFKNSSADFMKKLLLDLKELGISFVDINSSAKGIKQDSLQMASGIESLGLGTIPHITARDSLTEAVLSQVIGAYTWGGVRSVLVIKGDPKERKRSRRFRGGVYEHDSTELIRRLAAFSIERELDLSVGCAFSQTRPGKRMIYELKRLERKLSAGADFVMTQPVFYHPAWKQELGFLKANIRKPFLAGLWPIFDLETREKIWRGEVTGVILPDAFHKQLCLNWEKRMALQAERFSEMFSKMRKAGAAGAYIVSPFRKKFFDEFLEFLRMVKEKGGVL